MYSIEKRSENKRGFCGKELCFINVGRESTRVERGRSAPAEQARTGQAGVPRIVIPNSRETKKNGRGV